MRRERGDPSLPVGEQDVQDGSGHLDHHDRSPEFQESSPTDVLARFLLQRVNRDHT